MEVEGSSLYSRLNC